MMASGLRSNTLTPLTDTPSPGSAARAESIATRRSRPTRHPSNRLNDNLLISATHNTMWPYKRSTELDKENPVVDSPFIFSPHVSSTQAVPKRIFPRTRRPSKDLLLMDIDTRANDHQSFGSDPDTSFDGTLNMHASDLNDNSKGSDLFDTVASVEDSAQQWPQKACPAVAARQQPNVAATVKDTSMSNAAVSLVKKITDSLASCTPTNNSNAIACTSEIVANDAEAMSLHPPTMPSVRMVISFRAVLKTCMERLDLRSALFWCDKLVALVDSDDDKLTKCKLLHQLREFRRCIGYIDRNGLAEKHIQFRYLKALCLFEMREYQSALKELDECLKPVLEEGNNSALKEDEVVSGYANAKDSFFVSDRNDVAETRQSSKSGLSKTAVEHEATDDNPYRLLDEKYVNELCANKSGTTTQRSNRPETSMPKRNARTSETSRRRSGVTKKKGPATANRKRAGAADGQQLHSIVSSNFDADVGASLETANATIEESMMRFNAIRAASTPAGVNEIAIVESRKHFSAHSDKLDISRRSLYSAVYLLRGQIYQKLQNRALSLRSLTLSLLTDPTNYSAFDCLLRVSALSQREATSLINDIERERDRWQYDPIMFDALVGIYRSIASGQLFAFNEDDLLKHVLGGGEHDKTADASPVIKTNFVPNNGQQQRTKAVPIANSDELDTASRMKIAAINASPDENSLNEQENVQCMDGSCCAGNLSLLAHASSTAAERLRQPQHRYNPYKKPPKRDKREHAISPQNKKQQQPQQHCVVDNFVTPLSLPLRPPVAAGITGASTRFAQYSFDTTHQHSSAGEIGPHALVESFNRLQKDVHESTNAFWRDKVVADGRTLCQQLNKVSVELRAACARRQLNLYAYSETAALTAELLVDEPYYLDIITTHLGALVQLVTYGGMISNVAEGDVRPIAEIFQLAHSLVSMFPQEAVSWYAVGCYYYSTGKYDLARRFLLKSSTLNPNMGELWLLLGHCFAVESEHDQATSAYFRAAQILPSSHLPYHYIAKEYMRTDSLLLAGKFITDAMTLNDGDPELLLDAGILSIRKPQRVIDMPNKSRQACFVEALGYLRLAERYLRTDYKGRPKALLESVLYHTGYCTLKIGRLRDAIKYFEEARSIDSANIDTLKCLAWCYACERDRNQALHYVNQCLALAAAAPTAHNSNRSNYHRAGGIGAEDVNVTTMLAMLMEIPSAMHTDCAADDDDYEDIEDFLFRHQSDEKILSVQPEKKAVGGRKRTGKISKKTNTASSGSSTSGKSLFNSSPV